jgi:hypothetical protein
LGSHCWALAVAHHLASSLLLLLWMLAILLFLDW